MSEHKFGPTLSNVPLEEMTPERKLASMQDLLAKLASVPPEDMETLAIGILTKEGDYFGGFSGSSRKNSEVLEMMGVQLHMASRGVSLSELDKMIQEDAQQKKGN